jgi:hypothetical protein
MGMTMLVGHLQVADRLGAAVVSDDLGDLEQLLGHRPTSMAEGLDDLDAFVQKGSAETTADVLPVFHRLATRYATLWPASAMMGAALALPDLEI